MVRASVGSLCTERLVLRGLRISVPRHDLFIRAGLGRGRLDLCNNSVLRIKLLLATASQNRWCVSDWRSWRVPVRWVNLTDDELWHAITQNTDELLAVLALDADIGANELDKRADLMRSHLETVSRLLREYHEYTAELRRRYPLG